MPEKDCKSPIVKGVNWLPSVQKPHWNTTKRMWESRWQQPSPTYIHTCARNKRLKLGEKLCIKLRSQEGHIS